VALAASIRILTKHKVRDTVVVVITKSPFLIKRGSKIHPGGWRLLWTSRLG
jgi:hypothetical protein